MEEQLARRMMNETSDQAFRQLSQAMAGVGQATRDAAEGFANAFRQVTERRTIVDMSVSPDGRELVVRVNGEYMAMPAPRAELAYRFPLRGLGEHRSVETRIEAHTAGVELERDLARRQTLVNYRVNFTARMDDMMMEDLMHGSALQGGYAGQPLHELMYGITEVIQGILNGTLKPEQAAQQIRSLVVGAKGDKQTSDHEITHKVTVKLPDGIKANDQELKQRLEAAAAKAIEAEASRYVRETRGSKKPKRNVDI
tara:strand:- start:559 stop:1323 length:765 start_codon:yes stop_codon:yes gene_type:complete